MDIVREGEAADAMYVILAGEVQIYTRNGDGREVTLARLEAGDHFGEQTLLPGSTGRGYASVSRCIRLFGACSQNSFSVRARRRR
jgi:CRP-like cAMP-binding protein